MTVTLQTTNTLTDATPAFASLIYNRMRDHWKLPLDLMEGTQRMREERELYLPQHFGETKKLYEIRLKRTVLRNFFARTVETLVGKIFAKEIVMGKDVPEKLVEYMENVDLTGRHINIFAKDVLKDAIAAGITYILVDYPTMPPGISRAGEKELKARPYAKHIKAEDLLGFRSEFIGGVEYLAEIRIREAYVEQGEQEWTEVEEYRVRIYRPGSWELWESSKDNAWEMTDSGKTTLTFIPLVAIILEQVGFMEGRPPLEDLAWMNLEHYQIRSDQRVALSVASFPLLAASGWDKDQDSEIEIGPLKLLCNKDPQGKFYFVESGGAHLAAGDKELERLETQMRLFGLQFEVMQQSGNETATGRALDAAEGSAPLHTWAGKLQDALELMLQYFGAWEGVEVKSDATGSVVINKDFGITVRNKEELDALIRARGLGDISRETLINEFVRRGLLPDDFDVEAEVDKLEQETTTLGEFNVNQAAALAKATGKVAPGEGKKNKATSSQEGEIA